MENDKKTIVHRVSVREIVEWVLRSGDLSGVGLSSQRMLDGTKAHQKFQKQEKEAGNYDGPYQSEVFVDYQIARESVVYRLTGRIDGMVTYKKEGKTFVLFDEIKSSGEDVTKYKEGKPVHWAQVLMYAYMYSHVEPVDVLTCRLTYIELESFAIKQFEREVSQEGLENYFNEVLEAYLLYAKMLETFEEEMQRSLKKMTFPFVKPREGQEKLMRGVYRTIASGKVLFSRAPTGIGKTIATLFPSLKALGHEETSKIFYLTAKNVGKEVAVDTLNRLMLQGAQLKYTVITAKEKTCFQEVVDCNPEKCPYAKGHYDRVNEAIMQMYRNEDHFDRDTIENYARRYQVCPYELSLDMSSISQVVVCDYNYAFDPTAMLKRFFQESAGKYTLLVDEAHNLVDRSRSMYSSSLSKQEIMEVRKKVKDMDSRLYKYLGDLNRAYLNNRREMEEEDLNEKAEGDPPVVLEASLRGIIHRTEKIFKLHKDHPAMSRLLDFYFEIYDFVKKFELYDEHYRTLYYRQERDLRIQLFCIDPRANLREITRERQGVVYFSATLLPMPYYRYLLGGDRESFGLDLKSPFEKSNLRLLMDPTIGTRYVERKQSLANLIERIDSFIEAGQGNYLIYFPSYKYMEKGADLFLETYAKKNQAVMVQHPGMKEEEKDRFMHAFEEKKEGVIGFAVLGGMFSEGIDLVGERLTGAVIVGVGLPGLSFEQNLIRDYFEEKMGSGFDYAYTYPGMNKVLQAVGRVIRTEDDRGSVLLIDRRFASGKYKKLYPREWSEMESIKNKEDLALKLHEFWFKEK